MNATGSAMSAGTRPVEKAGYSFYAKLLLLYFLNIIDWICTEALLSSGRFTEANPIMRPVLESFGLTLLIKGALPLFMIIMCAVIFKIGDFRESRAANVLLYIGIGIYAAVNIWHIINFVLLFLKF